MQGLRFLLVDDSDMAVKSVQASQLLGDKFHLRSFCHCLGTFDETIVRLIRERLSVWNVPQLKDKTSGGYILGSVVSQLKRNKFFCALECTNPLG